MKIKALKMMMETAADPREILSLYCKKNQLSIDDVYEVFPFMTKEIFSSSFKLKKEVADKFPELFDREIWENNPNKSISFILEGDIIDIDELRHIVKNATSEELTDEITDRLIDLNDIEIKNIAFRKIMTTENILKHIDDFTGVIFSNPSFKKILNTKLIEEMINKRSSVDMEFFINALNAGISDLGWVKRMLNTQFNFVESSRTFDTTLIAFIKNIPELYISNLISLIKKYDQNALSYRVLCELLKMKDLDEETCIENFQLFCNNGLRTQLATYAYNHDYKTLSIMFGIS